MVSTASDRVCERVSSRSGGADLKRGHGRSLPVSHAPRSGDGDRYVHFRSTGTGAGQPDVAVFLEGDFEDRFSDRIIKQFQIDYVSDPSSSTTVTHDYAVVTKEAAAIIEHLYWITVNPDGETEYVHINCLRGEDQRLARAIRTHSQSHNVDFVVVGAFFERWPDGNIHGDHVGDPPWEAARHE